MPHHSQPQKALVSRHPHRPTNDRPQASSWLFVSWAQVPLASQLQLWARGCLLALYPFHRHHLRRISCLSCLFWAAWPLFCLHTMMVSLTSESAGGQPGAVSRQYLEIEVLWRRSTIASAVRASTQSTLLGWLPDQAGCRQSCGQAWPSDAPALWRGCYTIFSVYMQEGVATSSANILSGDLGVLASHV